MDPTPTLKPGGDTGARDRPAMRSQFWKRFPAFSSFRYRDFRWLFLSTFFAFTAVYMQQITRGWLILRLSDDSPFALSLVMMSFALPMTIASMLGGVLADRLSRKQIVILCQAGNGLTTLLLATLDLTGFIRFWHLIVLGFISGTLASFNIPSRQAITSDIVPENDLMNAISLNSAGMNLTRIIGPALAGILIVYLDTAGVFFLIVFVYAASAFLMALIREDRQTAISSGKGVTADIVEGLRYARRNPTLFGLVIMSFVPALFGFPYLALLPAWAREALNVEADGLGLLMVAMGLGSLVGTLILASVSHMKRRGLFLVINSFLWGVSLIFFARCPSFTTAFPSLFMVGLLGAVFMSLNMTLMQFYASPEMRGRVVSMGLMSFGIMPLSGVPFGAIAERIGTADSLQIAGLLLCLFTAVFFLTYPKFRNIA